MKQFHKKCVPGTRLMEFFHTLITHFHKTGVPGTLVMKHVRKNGIPDTLFVKFVHKLMKYFFKQVCPWYTFHETRS